MINVVIAENKEIVSVGLKSILSKLVGVNVLAVAGNRESLLDVLEAQRVDIVLLNYSNSTFDIEDVKTLKSSFDVKILAISETPIKAEIQKVIKSDVEGHILLCCDAEEIKDALYAIDKNNKFFCGKVLAALNTNATDINTVSCDAINLSNRELEIITMISEGFKNEEIASKLFLSPHTIRTHRKNIMCKLGVKNTAGIVIYAVKENIISPNKYLFSSSAVA